jgi:hypothetical protein
MNYHIPYHETILLMCAIIFPVGFGGNIAIPFQMKARQSISYGLIGMVSAYFIVMVLTFFVRSEAIVTFNIAPLHLYFVAPFIGFLCLIVEYCIGMFQMYLKTGVVIKKFVIHSSYSTVLKIKNIDLLMIFVFVIMEEYILRQTFFGIFLNTFKMEIWVIILLCACIYSINHITFGIQCLPQKLASGLIYTLIYYYSGMSVIIPIIAHATQNFTLLALSRTGRENG